MALHRRFSAVGIANLAICLFPYTLWVFLHGQNDLIGTKLREGGLLFALSFALLALYSIAMSTLRSDRALPFSFRSRLVSIAGVLYSVYMLCWVYLNMGHSNPALLYMIMLLPPAAGVFLAIDRDNAPSAAISSLALVIVLLFCLL